MLQTHAKKITFKLCQFYTFSLNNCKRGVAWFSGAEVSALNTAVAGSSPILGNLCRMSFFTSFPFQKSVHFQIKDTVAQIKIVKYCKEQIIYMLKPKK